MRQTLLPVLFYANGPIGLPKRRLKDYHSTLRNTAEDLDLRVKVVPVRAMQAYREWRGRSTHS
jgi:hypothetical protein